MLFYSFKDNQPLPANKYKYSTGLTLSLDNFLTINDLTVYDTANYTILANNGHLSKNVSFDLRVTGKFVLYLLYCFNVLNP